MPDCGCAACSRRLIASHDRARGLPERDSVGHKLRRRKQRLRLFMPLLAMLKRGHYGWRSRSSHVDSRECRTSARCSTASDMPVDDIGDCANETSTVNCLPARTWAWHFVLLGPAAVSSLLRADDASTLIAIYQSSTEEIFQWNSQILIARLPHKRGFENHSRR
jgi:hypothetical protein